jgi:hypothetical protein
MTREDDFMGQLEGYLDEYEGLTPLPDAMRDAIRAKVPTTRQNGSLPGPMRFLSMSMSIPTPARYGLAAAVVLTAAVLGAAFFARGGGIGADPTPTPPAGTLLEPLFTADLTNALEPGRYYVDDPFPVRVSVTVPEGWSSWAYTEAGSQIAFQKEDADPPVTGGELSITIVDNVSADPCETNTLLDPPVGPSVDDLVTALSNLPGFEASTPTDVTVDGFHGKRFTLTAAPEGDASCDGGETWTSTTRRNGAGAGEVNELRIIDVNGIRLLIAAAYHPPPSGEERSELQAVIESIDFLL